MDRLVQRSVAAPVKSVAGGLPAGGFDWAGPASLANAASLRQRPAWENDTMAWAALTGPIPGRLVSPGAKSLCSTSRRTRGLFRDLRRHLEGAWAQHTDTDPFAGDVWQVALIELQANASRRWPATQGVVDFRPIEPL
jgi:hypothetical protein